MSRFSPAGPANNAASRPAMPSIDYPALAIRSGSGYRPASAIPLPPSLQSPPPAAPPVSPATSIVHFKSSSVLDRTLADLRTIAASSKASAHPAALVADNSAKLFTKNTITVQGKLGSPFLPPTGECKVPALLSIATPKDVGVRQPFELVLLLDISGSMDSHGKLKKAKQAIKEIILSLEKEDILHLVVYSTTARVAFENGKLAESERLLTIVDALKTEGNTNISGGLQCAFQLLAGKTSPRRVFLFSDGEANEGVSAAIEMEQVVSFLHSHGVNVTSFGIGDSYEEKMMRAIAKAGHGDFFDMNKPEMIPSIVKKGMSVLSTLVASNLTLQLTPVNSTVIDDIVGYSSSTLAALGDISSDDLRQVLVKLVVPSPSAPHAPGTRADLFYWRLSFVLAGEATPSFLQGTVSCEYSDETSKLSLCDEDVKVALAIASASALDRQVYDLLASNKVPEARQAKREALRTLKEVAPIDKSGFVEHLITLGEVAERSMADTTKVAEVKKAVYWTGGASIVHRKCF